MSHNISPYVFPGTLSPNRILQSARVREVLDVVFAYFKVDMDYITLAERSRRRMRIKQITIYMLSQITGLGVQRVAHIVGLTNHTTVVHHVKYARNMIATEPQFASDIELLTQKITFLQ